jgi:hypothetical protein
MLAETGGRGQGETPKVPEAHNPAMQQAAEQSGNIPPLHPIWERLSRILAQQQTPQVPDVPNSPQPDQAEARKSELRKARNRSYYQEHREELIERARKWVEQNPDRAAELNRKSSLKYRQKNREQENAKARERYRRKKDAQSQNGETVVFPNP